MCRTGDFNMSYDSLTSYDARQKLRDLKTTDSEFWDELTRKSAAGLIIADEDNVAEDEENTDPFFEDDSDLPCDAIISTVLGTHPVGVTLNATGDVVSAAAAESLDNDKIDELLPNEVTENNDKAGETAEMGRGKRKRTSNKLYSTNAFWRHHDNDGSDEE
jgi:hypothetical protein